MVYDFASFSADAARGTLSRDGAVVSLPRKAFETLVVLLERGGDVVPKEELISRVWPDTVVEENNLTQSISALRKALGANLIETVSGRGYRFRERVAARKPARPRALAILPLRMLGSGDHDAYLGIGIADALITRLTNVRELVVRPTSSVLRLGECTAADAGRALGADVVLEGTVRKACDRIRVTVQLINVDDGAPIWAEKFDERFTEIFAVEDSISERVAEALTTRLSGEERSLLRRHATENSEAYRLFLNGRWYANRLTRDGSAKAVECMREAVASDPGFALGYAGIAYHFIQTADLTMPNEVAMTHAEEAARKALEIDDRLVDARAAVGVVRLFRDFDRAACEVEFERALSIDPRSMFAHDFYGWCLVLMGRFDRGFAELRTAMAIDPTSPDHHLYYPSALLFSRQYDESLAAAQAVIDRDPALWLMHALAGRALEAKGDLAGAIAAYERAREADDTIVESFGDLGRALGLAGDAVRARDVLQELDRRDFVPSFTRANVHLGLGDVDRAIALLEAAHAERSWYVTWLPIAPMLDSLRRQARFDALTRRMWRG